MMITFNSSKKNLITYIRNLALMKFPINAISWNYEYIWWIISKEKEVKILQFKFIPKIKDILIQKIHFH